MKNNFKFNFTILIFLFFIQSCSSNQEKAEGDRIEVFDKDVFFEDKISNFTSSFPKPKVVEEWNSSFGNNLGLQFNFKFDGNYKILWKKNIDKSSIFISPVISNNKIFVLTEKGNVVSLNSEGQEIWRTNILPVDEESGFLTGGGITLNNSKLIVTTSFGDIITLSRDDGKILWRNNFDGSFNMGATILDNRIYLISSKGLALCLSSEGEIIWSFLGPYEKRSIVNEPSPVIINKNILLPFNTGFLKLVDSTTGIDIWSYESKSFDFGNARSVIPGFSSSIMVSENQILTSNFSGQTRAIDFDGNLIWSNRFNSNDDIVQIDENIFLIDKLERIVIINRKNGKVINTKKIPNKNKSYIFGLKLVNSSIFILYDNGKLKKYDVDEETIIDLLDLKKKISSNFVTTSNIIYLGTSSGDLIAIR